LYNTCIETKKGLEMQHQKQYEQRVRELEAEGMTTSDAQGVADAEFIQQYGLGWEFTK
jgi:hypothetical protein